MVVVSEGETAVIGKNKNLLVLPGDGIGPEVMGEVRRVIDWFDRRRAVGFDVREGLVGGSSYEKHKTPLTDDVMGQAMESDAVLFGAVGIINAATKCG